jgi:hypothetical protein
MAQKPTVTKLTQMQRTVPSLQAMEIDELLPVPLNGARNQE